MAPLSVNAAASHGREIVRAIRNRDGQRRSILRRYAAHSLYPVIGSVSSYAAVTIDGVTYLVDTHDQVIGRSTFRRGSYDQAAMDEAVVLLASVSGVAAPLSGRVFIDVGANIGVTSVPAIRRYGAARVIAYEPDPHNHRLLRCNIILNGLDSRIEAVHAAVSNQAGSIELELSKTNPGDHRVRVTTRAGAFDESDRSTITVPAVTLDGEVTRLALSSTDVGLLWIDTQGHEGQVLDGAKELLAGRVPLLFEFWPYGLARAGGFELLADGVEGYGRLFDVRASLASGQPQRVSSLASLRDSLGGAEWTDVLAVP